MLIFRFTPNPAHQPTEEEQKAMKEAWGGFIGNIAISEKLISTHQLGFDGRQLMADRTTTEGMLIADQQIMGGNMTVKAASLDEATELAKDCPILRMGGTVEIRNILPMSA